MKIEDVQLDKIDIYGGTQTRIATNDEAISGYAEAMEAGEEFPPIVLYYDGAKYWLADGFHRYLARMRTQRATISAEVREGGRSDALSFALGANATNGLYRTNADKRNAVEIALEEWPERSNAVIAEICKVSIDLVRKCRGEMEKLNRIDEPKQIIGKDGKSYPNKIEREPRGKTEKSSSEGGGGGGGGRPKSKGGETGVGGSNLEIEAEARKMIRDGEMDPAELVNIRSATGIDYAQAAIRVLERMPADDPKRQEALQMLRKWLDREESGLGSTARFQARRPQTFEAALDEVSPETTGKFDDVEDVAVDLGDQADDRGELSVDDLEELDESVNAIAEDEEYDDDAIAFSSENADAEESERV